MSLPVTAAMDPPPSAGKSTFRSAVRTVVTAGVAKALSEREALLPGERVALEAYGARVRAEVDLFG